MQSISIAGSIDQQSQLRSVAPIRRSRLYPLAINPLHSRSRSPHALDTRSQKASPKRYLAYLGKNKKKRSYASQKQKSKQSHQFEKHVHNHSALNSIQEEQRIRQKINKLNRKKKQNDETYVQRYEQEKEALTFLSIRFASQDTHDNMTRQEAYIKAQKLQQNPQPQKSDTDKLPYIKYRKFQSPQQQLKQMGYSSDTRLASQIYSDKVQQKKMKYVNKMQALKNKLKDSGNYENGGNNLDIRRQRIQKSRIQVKILGQQIRRNRQRQLIRVQERKGRKMLQNLLKD